MCRLDLNSDFFEENSDSFVIDFQVSTIEEELLNHWKYGEDFEYLDVQHCVRAIYSHCSDYAWHNFDDVYMFKVRYDPAKQFKIERSVYKYHLGSNA